MLWLTGRGYKFGHLDRAAQVSRWEVGQRGGCSRYRSTAMYYTESHTYNIGRWFLVAMHGNTAGLLQNRPKMYGGTYAWEGIGCRKGDVLG